MRTLSDHIFDLVQNSINVGSERIHIVVEEDLPGNLFKIVITDDGFGIRPDQLSRIKDTFFTTRSRTKRNVGLGLSLMDATCERSGGTLKIESKYRYGTTVTALMEHDNIDRPPMGDLPDLFSSIMVSTMENKIIWTLEHRFNGKKYILKNRTTLDDLNILSYGEPGAKDKLYRFIVKKEKSIHS